MYRKMRDCPTLHLDTAKLYEQLVVRKDVDVNEHERLSNFTLGHKLNKETALLLLSTVHSHRQIFNNGQNSYRKMSVKQSQSAVKRSSLLLLIHYIFRFELH